jgi:hypothetical protein
MGDQEGVICTLEGLAVVAAALGQFERAAHHFAAAEALREAIGASTAPPRCDGYERGVGAVRAALEP